MENVTAIPNLPPFIPDDDPTSVAQRWKRWSYRFDNLMTAMNVTDNNRKKALLLHLAGEAVYDVFQGLIVPAVAEDADPVEDNVYLRAKRALDAHFDPQRNTEFEVYNFRKTQQMQGELIDSYHSRLRAMTKYCQFTNVDNEIKSHIIQTCTSTRLRRKALTEPQLTLNQLIDIGRAMETSERQLRSIEGATSRLTITDNQPVATIRRAAGRNRHQPTATPRPPSSSATSSTTCRNCGGRFPHPGGRSTCPAFGATCSSCFRKGHYWRLCRSQPANQPTGTTTGTTRHPRRGRSFTRRPRAVHQQHEPRQYQPVHQVTEDNQVQSELVSEEDDVDTSGEYLFHLTQRVSQKYWLRLTAWSLSS